MDESSSVKAGKQCLKTQNPQCETAGFVFFGFEYLI